MPIIVERPYSLEPKEFSLRDFRDRIDLFVLRPPYQRKNVWSLSKKEALIDSFFRRHYVPSIVLREVHTPKHDMRWEVVDGQQRIIAVQEFLDNKVRLPRTLADLTSDAGKYHRDLETAVREHIEERTLRATIIEGLTNPEKKKNQKLVTDIFWRLQQGESLSYMEVEHSKLYSAARGFVVKYADDISFDWADYVPLDSNRTRHRFFAMLPIDNSRLQHLAVLSRFLLLEHARGPADVGTKSVSKWIDDWSEKDVRKLEETPDAKRCLKTLDTLAAIFEPDPSVQAGGVVPELEREYLVLSIYLLASRLVHGGWNFNRGDYSRFRSFVQETYQRWKREDSDDTEILQFRDQRQQNESAISVRDQLISKWFFEANPDLDRLDSRRQFSYVERVAIYRKSKGLCQECLNEGLGEEQARVSWAQFDADHIRPHSRGGRTTIKNGQVLCRRHNRGLGSKD
ncbi:MAG: HNH endonuclease family protein [Thermoplasmata archaeon]